MFGGDGPQDAVTEFLTALADGDTARAAALTDSPDAAKRVLDQARSALEPTAIDTHVRQVDEWSDGQAAANYHLSWEFGKDRRWDYDGHARLESHGGEWKIRWEPTVLHPRLGSQQTLALRTETPPPAPVLDRDGAPLLSADIVVSVLLDRQAAGKEIDHVVSTLAGALGPLDSGITEKSITQGLAATEQGKPYLVASLRSTDYHSVKPVIYDLPGVRFTSQQRLLPIEKGLGTQILTAIRSTVQERTAGAAGWRVVTVDSTGAEIDRLAGAKPRPSEAVRTTLRLPTQQAADRAIDSVDQAGAIVALQVSTGQLLAVAQNERADAEGAIALTGRYPPGSTFKIATAAAGLTAGAVEVDTPLDCPPTTVIDDRLIPNDDEFGLGTVPLHTAFAHSCNTTFSRLAADLPPPALPDAARSLGIGADFVIPGITTVTGSAPPGESSVQRAENGIGQGTVVASPFGMAVAAATVASGTTPVPSLLQGEHTTATRLGKPLSPAVLAALRDMMREVVTDGTAQDLRDLPGVHGKTGTAQFGDGTRSHGWFVGYQSDLAFAVLLVDAGSSAPAVNVAHRFLGAAT